MHTLTRAAAYEFMNGCTEDDYILLDKMKEIIREQRIKKKANDWERVIKTIREYIEEYEKIEVETREGGFSIFITTDGFFEDEKTSKIAVD